MNKPYNFFLNYQHFNNPEWNLNSPEHFDALRLNKKFFDISWSYAPEGSPSMEERFLAADEGWATPDGWPTIKQCKYVKYNYRMIDGYHVLDTVPPDNIREEYKDQVVEYRYNSDWFRSDHFKKEHSGIHIVFAGCSNTEGIGQNINQTWSYLLYSEIKKHYEVDGYFNIARSGSGLHTIVHNFMVYVKKYGAPEYLFLLAPNILRYWSWDDDQGWRYHQDNVWDQPQELKANIFKHRLEFPKWASLMTCFIEYCNAVGTKIIWSEWDTWETKNIQDSNLFNDTFIPAKIITENDLMNKYYHTLDHPNVIDARDGHDGYLKHYHWYTTFKDKLVKDGFLNENN